MATIDSKIVPHLWFDKEARQAAEFYVSVFQDSRVKNEVTLKNTPSGTVQLVTFELFSQEFRAISAGPLFKFNESISFIVRCDTQAEIDVYWERLVSDGGEAGQCGWLKDRFGLSWQIVPRVLEEMMASSDDAARARVVGAFLKLGKLDIAALRNAFKGEDG